MQHNLLSHTWLSSTASPLSSTGTRAQLHSHPALHTASCHVLLSTTIVYTELCIQQYRAVYKLPGHSFAHNQDKAMYVDSVLCTQSVQSCVHKQDITVYTSRTELWTLYSYVIFSSILIQLSYVHKISYCESHGYKISPHVIFPFSVLSLHNPLV